MKAFARLALAATAALLAVGTAHAAPQTCDESCLLGIADQYMDGITADDPASVPFAAHVRATENSAITAPGQGVWTTAKSWLYRHTVVDPVTGEIGAFGSVHEADDQDAMLAMRLKVVDRKIVESELMVVRPGEFALFQPRYTVEPHPLFTDWLPADHRMTRAELAAVPRHYFDALAAGDPGLVKVHPDAVRFENGVQTTDSQSLLSPSITEGIRTLVYMKHTREYRVPVIDVDHGLVLAITVVDMPKTDETITVHGRPTEISSEKHHLPRSLMLFELFKVEDGRIRAIEAVMRNGPLGSDMGWPGASK